MNFIIGCFAFVIAYAKVFAYGAYVSVKRDILREKRVWIEYGGLKL